MDSDVLNRYLHRVRRRTETLVSTLTPEDTVVQPIPEVSPTKWHLAHTSWFFEEFVLSSFLPDYRRFHPQFAYLFNSYYQMVGPMHRRPKRGFLSRPTLEEVMAYRHHVDSALTRAIGEPGDKLELFDRIILGCHHEQQHQELILTDIKYVFSINPMHPAWDTIPEPRHSEDVPSRWIEHPGGMFKVGYSGNGFCFDNEMPRHTVYLDPFALASRLVTNAEFKEFIHDGGYEDSGIWLSDGWDLVQNGTLKGPLYWMEDLESEFTLGGVRRLQPNAPVCHVSYYEADAYAKWAGRRLPTENEWEILAFDKPIVGNLADRGLFHPAALAAAQELSQIYGDVWEWTSSAYLPYPHYRSENSALGEYNGKFMCGQHVLKGGSCATPEDHIRPTYRNFFYPDQRWQFTGIRLAKDL